MVDITQDQWVYGRLVFRVNFHEEIMILAFILYTQNTNMLVWLQCSWWDFFGHWEWDGWWVPNSCVLVGLLTDQRRTSMASDPSCALAAPYPAEIVRFPVGFWHFSKWEIKSLQGLFLWGLHNEVVSVRMFFSCISHWHLILLRAGGWTGWPLEVPANQNYSVMLLYRQTRDAWIG